MRSSIDERENLQASEKLSDKWDLTAFTCCSFTNAFAKEALDLIGRQKSRLTGDPSQEFRYVSEIPKIKRSAHRFADSLKIVKPILKFILASQTLSDPGGRLTWTANRQYEDPVSKRALVPETPPRSRFGSRTLPDSGQSLSWRRQGAARSGPSRTTDRHSGKIVDESREYRSKIICFDSPV